MAPVGDGKQEVVGHGFVDVVALIFHVAGVDVGLREGPRYATARDEQSAVAWRLDHDVRKVVRRRAFKSEPSK